MSGLDEAIRDTVREQVRQAVHDLVLPALRENAEQYELSPLMTSREVQRVLRIGWNTLDDLCKRGELVGIEIGNSRRVTAESVRAFIESHRLDVADQAPRLRAVAP